MLKFTECVNFLHILRLLNSKRDSMKKTETLYQHLMEKGGFFKLPKPMAITTTDGDNIIVCAIANIEEERYETLTRYQSRVEPYAVTNNFEVWCIDDLFEDKDIETLIEYEFDERETCFFLTPEDRTAYRETYLKEHTREDCKYIPNINSIDFYEREYDFSDVKDEMTVEQFESLFHTNVDQLVVSSQGD